MKCSPCTRSSPITRHNSQNSVPLGTNIDESKKEEALSTKSKCKGIRQTQDSRAQKAVWVARVALLPRERERKVSKRPTGGLEVEQRPEENVENN